MWLHVLLFTLNRIYVRCVIGESCISFKRYQLALKNKRRPSGPQANGGAVCGSEGRPKAWANNSRLLHFPITLLPFHHHQKRTFMQQEKNLQKQQELNNLE